jgi:hypothetical protein
VRFVGPGALEALGLRPLSGRLLQASDGKPQPDAAVVSEGFAKRFLSGRDPVGQVLNVRLNGKPTIRTIVGVVPDVRDRTLIGELQPVMFALFDAESAERRRSFLLRTSSEAGDVAQAVSTSLQRAGIAARVRPLVDTRDRQFATARFCTLVITAFGGIALVLVLVGVAGVVGEAVLRRTREIGVRIAVGARPPQVVRLVLRQVTVPTAVGACIGIAAAAWFARGLRAVLFEVEPNDPLTLLVVLTVVGGSALAAAWLPARRAARIDPVEALKVE